MNHDSAQTRAALNAIRQIVRGLNVSSRACEKTNGLTSAQLFVLQKLRESEALSINELAKKTLTHQSTVSVVVSRLVQRRLVSRKPSLDDRRRLVLSLTAAGASLLRNSPKTAQEKLIDGFNKMPAASQKTLIKSLTDWVELSGLAQTPAPMFFEETRKKGRS